MSDSILKNQERLVDKFTEIKTLDPNIPSDINRLIKLHIQAQFIMAKIEEQAIINEGDAYAERKKIQAEITLEHKGTGVEKEATAELAIFDLRQQETKARAMVWSFRRQSKAIDNTIIAYRFDEKILHEEMVKTNDIENR